MSYGAPCFDEFLTVSDEFFVLPRQRSMSKTGEQAVVLLQRWRAHANDDHAAMQTILAVYGAGSVLGGFASSPRETHPPYEAWLTDLAYDYGMAEWPPQIATRSPATVAVIAHQINWMRGRRPVGSAVLPAETRVALIDYYRERLELLMAIGSLYGQLQKPAYSKIAARHITACRQALERLWETPG